MKKEKLEAAQKILDKINSLERTISNMEALLSGTITGAKVVGARPGKFNSPVEVRLTNYDKLRELMKGQMEEDRVELDKLHKEFASV